MNNKSFASMRPSTWLARMAVVLPGILFYLLLLKSWVNLPIADDYDAVLAFGNRFAELSGSGQRILHVLTYQHNEYKLIFENTLIALQIGIAGHVSFQQLVLLGNAFVLVLFLLLVLMYRAPGDSETERLVLLLPVSLLFFQLQYASTLNWAMISLQGVTVLVFSLLAILLICRKGVRAGLIFGCACISLVLAICSSGNGFIAGMTCLLVLVQQKRWKQTAVWLALLFGITMVYFYRYSFHTSQSDGPRSVGGILAQLNPAYALSFMGSSLAAYQSYVPSVCFGIVLCALVIFAIRRRYYLVNPAVFYSMVFIVVTAMGVSGTRSHLGILQSLASRYRIYSNLLVIFSYMFLTETYWREGKVASRKLAIFSLAFAIVCCMAFCGASDRAGYRFLKGRKQAVLEAMSEWQHPSAMGVANVATSQQNAIVRRQMEAGIFKPDGPVLLDSIRLGIYRPPTVPLAPVLIQGASQ